MATCSSPAYTLIYICVPLACTAKRYNIHSPREYTQKSVPTFPRGHRAPCAVPRVNHLLSSTSNRELEYLMKHLFYPRSSLQRGHSSWSASYNCPRVKFSMRATFAVSWTICAGTHTLFAESTETTGTVGTDSFFQRD